MVQLEDFADFTHDPDKPKRMEALREATKGIEARLAAGKIDKAEAEALIAKLTLNEAIARMAHEAACRYLGVEPATEPEQPPAGPATETPSPPILPESTPSA